MLKDLTVILIFASAKIVLCDNVDLPEAVIPDAKLINPQNPPQIPRIYLTGQKFSLPQFCSNTSEWEDVDLSLKILADNTEPEPERSAFAALINLIKFILIKEELSCVNAMSGPILKVNRPEGKIFNAVATLENSQILNKIEKALANRPRHKAPPIDFYDSIDITNMIPIWRPRANNRKSHQVTVATEKEIKANSTCNAGPKALQNLGPGLTIIGGNLNTLAKSSPSKTPCPCSKCPTLAMNVKPQCPNCNMQCQSLPSTNVKPLVIGCGGNCNFCQKLSNPVLSGCPKLASASIFSGCPNTNILGGCPCSNTVMGCPTCSGGSPCKTQQSVTVLQSETVPLMNCYGNLMKKVTTTVLVPYTMSQLVA